MEDLTMKENIERLNYLEERIPFIGSEEEKVIKKQINDSISEYDSETIHKVIISDMQYITEEKIGYYSYFFDELEIGDFVFLYKSGFNLRVRNLNDQIRENIKNNVTNIVLNDGREPVIYTEVLDCSINITGSHYSRVSIPNKNVIRNFDFQWFDYFTQVDARQLNYNDGDIIIDEICEDCIISDRSFHFQWEDDLEQSIYLEDIEEEEIQEGTRVFSFEWIEEYESSIIGEEENIEEEPRDRDRRFDIILNADYKVIRSTTEQTENENINVQRDRRFTISLYDKTVNVFSRDTEESVISPSFPPSRNRIFSAHFYFGIDRPYYPSDRSSGGGSSGGGGSGSSSSSGGGSGGGVRGGWSGWSSSSSISRTAPTRPRRIGGGGGGGGGPAGSIKTKPDIIITLTCGMSANNFFLSDGSSTIEVDVPTITKQCDTGIFETEITDEGFLVFNFNECDNTPLVAGKVKGVDGKDGKNIVYFDIKDDNLISVITTVNGKYTPDVSYEKVLGSLTVPYIVEGFTNDDGLLTFKDNSGLYLITNADLWNSVSNGRNAEIPLVRTLESRSKQKLLHIESRYSIMLDEVIREKSDFSISIDKNNDVIIRGNGKELLINKYIGDVIDITDIKVINNKVYIEKNLFDVEVLDDIIYEPLNELVVDENYIEFKNSKTNWKFKNEIESASDGRIIESAIKDDDKTTITLNDEDATEYIIPTRKILEKIKTKKTSDGIELTFDFFNS